MVSCGIFRVTFQSFRRVHRHLWLLNSPKVLKIASKSAAPPHKLNPKFRLGGGIMSAKNIIAILVIICGIALIVVSNVIKSRVEEGRIQVSSAQGQVDTANQLFSMHPYGKEAGKHITGSAQSQINAGNQQILYYVQVADWAQIGGIVLIVIGVGIFFIRGKRK